MARSVLARARRIMHRALGPITTPPASEPVGRYVLLSPIARGGMATVHAARLVGDDGFSRLVAAKRLHPQFVDDPDVVAMFHDEAIIASKIHHPNVVPVLDVVASGTEVILVQEYVHGVPLSHLFKVASKSAPIDPRIACAIVAGLLAGLHAAHETRDDDGRPLEIIHRDVSMQNVLVSVDGAARLVDFGIAKARTSTHHTQAGIFKGKLAYMAPEQLRFEPLTRQIDVYATGVILWQLLANRRFHDGDDAAAFVAAITAGAAPTLTAALAAERASMSIDRWAAVVALEPVVARALASSTKARYASAAEMLTALFRAIHPATSIDVAEWVRVAGAEYLRQRDQVIAYGEGLRRSRSPIEPVSSSGAPPPTPPLFTRLAPRSALREASGVRLVSSDAPTISAEIESPKSSPLFWAIAFLIVGFLCGAVLVICTP